MLSGLPSRGAVCGLLFNLFSATHVFTCPPLLLDTIRRYIAPVSGSSRAPPAYRLVFIFPFYDITYGSFCSLAA